MPQSPIHRKFLQACQLMSTVALAMATSACATSYQFVTEPEGASIFHEQSTGNALLGVSPITFSKSGLPADVPFVVIFEKPGFETLRVVVAPTDGARTTVNGVLKPAALAKDDPSLQRTRRILSSLFEVQEYVAQKRYVDALSSIRKLEASEPDLPELYALKGSVYFILSDLSEARAAWTKALALDPKLDAGRSRLNMLQSPDTPIRVSEAAP